MTRELIATDVGACCDPGGGGGGPPDPHAATHLPGGSDALATDAAGAIEIGDVAGEGSAASFARSDHTHSLAAPLAPVEVNKSAAATGTDAVPARADHKHDIETGAPGSGIGAGNTEGTSSSIARADHDHTIRESGGQDLTMGAVADGEFLTRSGTTIVGVSSVFGGEAQEDQRVTPATTSSPTFANYFNFNTSALVGGNYFFTFSFSLSGPGANIDLGARLVFGGVPTAEIAMGTSTADGLVIATWSGVLRSVSAGSKLVAFEFRKIAGSGDVTANSVYATMWRLS